MIEIKEFSSQTRHSGLVNRDVVLAHLKSTSIQLRRDLTTAGLEWEEIPGCFPWLQVELTTAEFFAVLLNYENIEADLLD